MMWAGIKDKKTKPSYMNLGIIIQGPTHNSCKICKIQWKGYEYTKLLNGIISGEWRSKEEEKLSL